MVFLFKVCTYYKGGVKWWKAVRSSGSLVEGETGESVEILIEYYISTHEWSIHGNVPQVLCNVTTKAESIAGVLCNRILGIDRNMMEVSGCNNLCPWASHHHMRLKTAPGDLKVIARVHLILLATPEGDSLIVNSNILSCHYVSGGSYGSFQGCFHYYINGLARMLHIQLENNAWKRDELPFVVWK